MRLGRHLGGLALSVGVVAALHHPAAAQDIEVPILVVEQSDTGEAEETDDELDLANLVTSAAKSVTTVQEAPAIITIIPAEELADRQAIFLTDVIDLIPGFLRVNAFYGTFPQAMSRGLVQAVLVLHDGFSMFDPDFNVMNVQRGVPLEMVKRVETVSGPGGVLWGANSFMGVLNVITKDPEDIDGVEAGVYYGDGNGNRTDFRGYALAGLPQLFGKEDWGLVLHASFDNYQGEAETQAGHMFSTPLPNPNSYYLYGPIQSSDQPRSTVINMDGKLIMGKLTLQVNVPIMHRYQGSQFNGPLSVDWVPEENRPQINFYERWGLAEYKTRFSEKAGMSAKVSFIQFLREFTPVLVLMPSPLISDGLAFNTSPNAYRVATVIDGDVELSDSFRLLYGVEASHDWIPDTTKRSRQGPGTEADFLAPEDETKLPFLCPREGTWNAVTQTPNVGAPVDGCPLTFMFEVGRTTVGGFTSLQFRPSKRLIFDGGVRLQAAPELVDTSNGYGLTSTFSAAAVYEFATNWHLKVNYAEGFRPPVFINTNGNGDGVQIDGSPDLAVETSRSAQFEVNARLLKGKKRVRELDVRMDYSYTTLDNFIAFIGGRYANTAERGIHSGEFLAKLYIKGGHRFELGYTYNRIDMADKGAFHSSPNNWFNISSVNRLGSDKVEMATVLRVYGAFEDPNRRVEARGLKLNDMGVPDAVNGMVEVQAYETVMDRQPPAAELQVGVRWHPWEKVQIQGTVYNAFNNHRGSYDNADDLEPRLEIVPSRFQGFRFFTSISAQF